MSASIEVTIVVPGSTQEKLGQLFCKVTVTGVELDDPNRRL